MWPALSESLPTTDTDHVGHGASSGLILGQTVELAFWLKSLTSALIFSHVSLFQRHKVLGALGNVGLVLSRPKGSLSRE